MKIIDNITETVRDDMAHSIARGGKVSIAAACFSMYAYNELKKQLESMDEFRFIFTSPTFVTERAEKAKREFYIPRFNREQSLYGTEFEIKLRSEMTQYMQLFDTLWNDRQKFQDVTDVVIDNITTAYNENSPEMIYFITLYNVFNEFLEDISEDVLQNEATGFKSSKIWGRGCSMTYNEMPCCGRWTSISLRCWIP